MKNLFLVIICFPLIFLGQFSNQEQQLIDSLNAVVADPNSSDTTVAATYLELSGILYVSNIDTMIPLCNKVIEICERNLVKNLQEIEKIQFLNSLSGALNNIAFVNMNNGKVNQCLYYLQESLSIFEETGDEKGIATITNNIGYIFNDQGNSVKALEYYLRSLQLETSIDNKIGIATSLNNIASIYREQNDTQNALDYYQKSLDILELLDNQKGIASVNNSIGAILEQNGKKQQAFNCFSKALDINTGIGNKEGVSNCLSNIGSFYMNQDKIDSALIFFTNSLKIRREINFKDGIAISTYSIAKAFFKKGEFKNAKKYALESLVVSKEIGYPRNIKTAAKILSEIYEKEKNSSEALQMMKLFVLMKDSVDNQEAKKKLDQQQIKYEYETKKKEDDLQHELQIALKDEKLKSEESFNKLLIVLLLLIAFFLIYIIERLYKINKQNKLIAHQKTLVEQKNKILERLSLVVSKTENVILILDANGNVEWVNDSFEKLNNLTYDQLIIERGKHIVDVSNQEDISEILTTCEKTKKPYRYDSLNITMDGDHIWESSTITPIYDVDGALSNFIIIDTDISKQKNAEELVVRKNKDITDSINYAKRLQNAILPNINSLTDNKLENFILYLPKGILSGDFYWIEKFDDKIYFAVADCTGHGVPGAMVSVICSSVLSKALLEEGLKEPASILNRARELVVQRFVNSEQEIRDGMDISLCALDLENNTLQWSGANNPLWIVRSGENTIEEVVADKQPIGMFITKKPFNNHTISINKGDNLYLFSDGFADQFGAKRGKKYKSTNFNKFILSIKDLSMEDQLKALHDEFYTWMGDFEQIDDVCVMGVRI